MKKIAIASETGNNYCKMADGTLIQWGRYYTANANKEIEIFFPVTFINSDYSVSYCVYWHATGYYFIFFDEKASSISALAKYNASNESLPTNVSIGGTWMAIGRWK